MEKNELPRNARVFIRFHLKFRVPCVLVILLHILGFSQDEKRNSTSYITGVILTKILKNLTVFCRCTLLLYPANQADG